MAKKLINAAALQLLGTASNAAFQKGLASRGEAIHLKVATRVNSTTGKEEYGWLGKWPRIREWIGERVAQQLAAHEYSIKNKPYESTVKVDRDDVEDDNIGIYSPMFQFLGEEVADFPSELVFGLLKDGFTTPCYDGQNFFDTDHPVLDADGAEQSVSNSGGGAGAPWFLIDVSRALKPIIFQVRRDFERVNLDNPDDPNVFWRKEFVYGVDGRMNVGFGFWQFAYGSRQPLTAENYEAARVALANMTGDYGRPLNIKGNLLVTVPSLEGAGKEILENERNAAGGTNKWRNTAELFTTAWLN